MRHIKFVLLVIAAIGAQKLVADDVIVWNNILLQSIREAKTPPPIASRAMAIVHIAIFDAVNSIDKGYEKYHFFDRNTPGNLSKHAAIASAAYTTLKALFPAYTEVYDEALEDALEDIPNSPQKLGGFLLGIAAAEDILSLRENDPDGTVAPDDAPELAPGVWRPTPPANASYLLPGWAKQKPFAMRSQDQFRKKAPPALNTGVYAKAFNRVKSLGSKNSTTRTEDQSEIAVFWADGPGTVTPPGHWNTIAQTASQIEDLSLVENAHLFAILNIALADAAIVAWDMKFEYYYWRPVTAIRLADTDGNNKTTKDAAWEPFIATPPFPAYTSGHSTFSEAGAGILQNFFDTDRFNFNTASDALPGVVRSFRSFSQASDEAGVSRIYGGIHFQFDDEIGERSGAKLADYVYRGFLNKKD